MKKTITIISLIAATVAAIPFAFGAEEAKTHYKNIVSTAGSYSEIIAKLGEENRLVGVDTTSILPKTIMDPITKIGYRRALSAEGILSLQSDVIFLAPDSGPEIVIKQLSDAGANLVHLPDQQSTDGIIQNINYIASVLGVADKAAAVINDIEQDLAQSQDYIKTYSHSPSVAFLMSVDGNKLIGLGANSSGDNMINLVGGSNVFANDFNSIKPVSREGLIATSPEIILIAQRDTVTLSSIASINNDHELNKLVTKACIINVDLSSALGWGPSFSKAAKSISEKIHYCLNKKA